ncbi:MAG: cytochrome c biogenesis protein CcdA [Thermoleophilaceae bacterium]|nr:cytochrome c biogenesis protein CcdA [Thermoleophilaceae bacterium]
MVDSPSLALALAAGFVSFVSPCCLPLVPGYLAAISGGKPPVAGERPSSALLGRSLIFIATFSLVFILLGLSTTAFGSLLGGNQLLLRKIAGAAIIVMGLLFIGSAFLTGLNRDWRVPGLIERAGRGGPVIAGLAFALAWTPCVGPTLGAILGLAATQSTAEAGLLLAVYSLGLAIPFFVSALGFGAAQNAFDWIRRHYRAIQIVSGGVLVVMGTLVYTNELTRLNIEAQKLLDGWGLNFFQSV